MSNLLGCVYRNYRQTTSCNADGFALVSSLIILLVMTLLGVSMSHGFNMEEKTSGNLREKQRSLQAAQSALQYAEWSLGRTSPAPNAVPCSSVQTATVTPVVCSNALASVTTVPWGSGVSYSPPNMTFSTSGGSDTYYSNPNYYIQYLGAYSGSVSGDGTLYQVDAYGYGGTQNTVSEVESVYLVASSNIDLGHK